MPTRLVRLAGLWLLVAAPALVAAPVPKAKPKTTADKLVGTWRLVKTSQAGGVKVTLLVDLAADGTMTARQSADGEDDPDVRTGTYKVDGETIPYTLGRGDGSDPKSETLTIKKLTDDELVVVDPDGIQEDFQREKPAAKPKKSP